MTERRLSVIFYRRFMLKIFSYAFILLSTLNCCCYGIEISQEEALVLEEFFRITFEKSEGGYVFYGKKPICIQGFLKEDDFLQENDQHLCSVYLREGAIIWKHLNKSIPNQNIIVHVYDDEDTLAKNYIHILCINKKLCLDTISSNLPLFQYVLGPDITPSRLLDKLVDPSSSFHSILKNDKVLIGILLGFGTQNSLYVSRIENLQEDLFTSEKPPFLSQVSRLNNVQPEFRQMLLYTSIPFSPFSTQNSSTLPSFGHSSLNEEIQNLNQKIDISSLILVKQLPPFIFGRLKNHVETDKLVRELEVTQSNVKQFISSDNFLAKVLRFIYPKEKITIYSGCNKHLLFEESEIKQLPSLVAANIWRILKSEDERYQQAFIEGMKDAEKFSEFQLQNGMCTSKYRKLQALLKIRKNLKEAEDYFTQLDKRVDLIQVLPFKLYYKVIQEGNGELLDRQTNVLLNYIIRTPNDQIVANTEMFGHPNSINLADTIPGFAWGVKGMKVGETREVFIHPTLAYGVYTTSDKGIYLKSHITLVGINEEEDGRIFPILAPLDLPDVSPTIDIEYEEEVKKEGYAKGYQSWYHYKKMRLYYSLDSVLKWIDRLQSGENVEISSIKNQNTINRLHWNIYHLDKSQI